MLILNKSFVECHEIEPSHLTNSVGTSQKHSLTSIHYIEAGIRPIIILNFKAYQFVYWREWTQRTIISFLLFVFHEKN